MVTETQFCFFPKHQPRYYNPGSRCFCFQYNKPDGDGCDRERFKDPEFPNVPMCGTFDSDIRVHGCTWCGEIGHPASRCKGPSLEATDVQMTLVEFNKWDRKPKKDWLTARTRDKVIERTRDPDGRFRNP